MKFSRFRGVYIIKINYACSSRGKKIYATLDGGSCLEVVFEHG